MYLFRIFPSSYTLGLLDSYAGGRARSDSQKDFSHWKTVSPGQEIPFSYKERDKIRHQVYLKILFHLILNSNLNVFRIKIKYFKNHCRSLDGLIAHWYPGKNAFVFGLFLADTHTFLRKKCPFYYGKSLLCIYICTLLDSSGLRTIDVFRRGEVIKYLCNCIYRVPMTCVYIS